MERPGISIVPVTGAEMLALTATHGRTEESGGAIKSQYAEELQNGNPDVGALGIVGCGELLGGMTFGFHSMPKRPGSRSGRIDVVVTLPRLRGKGLAGIVTANYVLRCADGAYGQVDHLSVIAQHPSIEHIVKELGFEAAEIGSAPLYQIHLDGEKRGQLLRAATRLKTDRMTRLQGDCRRCIARDGLGAWCKKEAA